MCLVSIIVPIYNANKYLIKCVGSILAQTLKDIEIILVNDGSKDDSLEICNQFSKSDHRIIIIDKKNEGVSQARNVGIDKAKGEYISFVDADDWIEPNMYENMYNKLKSTNSKVCICNGYRQKGNEMTEIKVLVQSDQIQQISAEYIIGQIIGENRWGNRDSSLAHRGVYFYLYKRDQIGKIRFNRELPMGEDLLFNINVLGKTQEICIDEGYYYHYIWNTSSSTQEYENKFWNVLKKMIVDIEKALEDIQLKEVLRDRFNIFLIEHVRNATLNEYKAKNKRTVDKIKEIKNVCKDPLVQQTIAYELKKKLQMRYKLLLLLLKYKCAMIMYLEAIIRNH